MQCNSYQNPKRFFFIELVKFILQLIARNERKSTAEEKKLNEEGDGGREETLTSG